MALIDKLTSVADAIRSKTGKTDSLTLEQMPGEIEGIQTGGSGDLFDQYLTYEIEEINSDARCYLHRYQFENQKNLKRVNLPNGYYGDENLRAFSGCSSLEYVNIPGVTTFNGNLFNGCSALKYLNAPNLKEMHDSVFPQCTSLEMLDFPALTTLKYGNNFNGLSNLKTLILRANSVCSMANVSAFNGTPFASGGTGGTVYVPEALIESYKTATNWSTLYAEGTCNFVAIEGSEYE